MKYEPVKYRQSIKDRNQANRVRRKDEEKERQNQRGPGHNPFASNVRLCDIVAHKFHDGFESIHEAGRNQAVLAEISSHGDRHDEEDKRRHEPEHKHMLSDREIDSKHRRKLNQRQLMIIGNVLDDSFTGIEMRFSRFGRSDMTHGGFLNECKSKE